MTLALATRGYICQARQIPVPVVIPGLPTIDVTEQKPDVTKVLTKRDKAPTIISAKQGKPVIQGATTSAPTPPVPSPSITKAKKQTPTIRRVKKD